MTKFFRKFLEYYYWIYVVLGILSFIKFRDLYSLVVLLTVGAVFYSYCMRPFKFNALDWLVALLIVYQLFSYGFSYYPVQLWYYGVKGQIIPMLFYFLGRNMMFADNKLLAGMKWPILFAMVVGLILYFWAPSWYIARRTASLAADASASSYYEVTRLSSFWPWSYTIGFASLIFIMYYAKDFFTIKKTWLYYFSLTVAVLVLFFAQLRVTIAFFIVFIGLMTFFSPKQYRKKLIYIWLFFALLAVAIYVYLTEYADSDLLEYILNRSVDSDENIVVQRFEMFESYWNVSPFGQGLGKYCHTALEFNMRSITDCEYIRVMAELGVIGYIFFGLIYIIAMVRSLRKIHFYFFEFCIISLFLAVMIGATPLENYSMQNFMLWYCMGRIGNKNLLKEKKYTQIK